jgi:hypothetical protein
MPEDTFSYQILMDAVFLPLMPEVLSTPTTAIMWL